MTVLNEPTQTIRQRQPGEAEQVETLIVGSGPAGLLAAYTLAQRRPGARTLIVDAGPALGERSGTGAGYMAGYGGAGLYLGGRLYLGPASIPVLPPTTPPPGVRAVLSGDAYLARAHAVDAFFQSLGAQTEIRREPPEQLAALVAQAGAVGLDYVTTYPVRLLTIEERQRILRRLLGELDGVGARMRFGQQVAAIRRDGDGAFAVELRPGAQDGAQDGAEHAQGAGERPQTSPQVIRARTLLLAPGRYGAEWLVAQLGELGARVVALPGAFGVRLELAATTYAPLTSVTPDPRLQRALPAQDAFIKTYATCPGGLVTAIERFGELVVSGVPLPVAERGPNTTVAILVQPGVEGAAGAWRDGDSLAARLNARAPGAVLVQRLGNLRRRRPTTSDALATNAVQPSCAEAVPGALRDAYPEVYWSLFDDFLGRIERLAPGVAGDDTLVYGPAHERFWTIPTGETLQTTTPGLFVAGDGPGQSQGIIQAGVAGALAGEGIARYLDERA